jgi:chromosome segregation ATPase
LNDNIGNAIGAYRVYRVDSCVEESCIKSKSKSVLRDAILQQKNTLDSSKSNIDKLEVRLTAIDENIDESVASARYSENKQRREREQQTKEKQEQLAQYEDLLNNIRLSHKSSKQLLSDKNRLIASTSSNIQTSTDKLEDLNNKINEANQEIAKNNSDFEKKNNIITTLRAMITIFFILLLVMIVYYGALYTRDAYPETYNSISNSINNSFSGFSSFNANY